MKNYKEMIEAMRAETLKASQSGAKKTIYLIPFIQMWNDKKASGQLSKKTEREFKKDLMEILSPEPNARQLIDAAQILAEKNVKGPLSEEEMIDMALDLAKKDILQEVADISEEIKAIHRKGLKQKEEIFFNHSDDLNQEERPFLKH